MPLNNEGKYGYLFMQDLKLPATHEKVLDKYREFGERVHWVDGNNIPGAFQMNTSWWYNVLELYRKHIDTQPQLVKIIVH